MGMDPNAIQHDRDKIRYTKRAKKIKEEEAMDVTEITSGKSVFLKEEAESPPSTQGNDDVANLSSPSSSAGQAPASNDSGSGTGVDEKATTNNGTLQGPAIPGIDVPEPPPSTEIKNIKQDVQEMLGHLLKLEQKVMDVRCANRFPSHNTVASCVFDRKLLEDQEWLRKYQTHVCFHYEPKPCERENMRYWFCKDLTLLIEWAKCLPNVDNLGLLLNDKLALVKAMAPVYPLLQLAFYSCTHDIRINFGSFGPSDRLCAFSNICANARMSLDSNGGYGSDMPGFSRNYDGPYVNRLWYPDGKYLEREEQQTDPTMKRTPPVHTLLLDSVCNQFVKYGINEKHMVLYKQMLYYNPDADGLSSRAKEVVTAERIKTLNRLYWLLSRDRNSVQTAEAFSALLLIASTLARIASYLKRTFDITHIFGPANDLIDQLIIIGL
ncbi:unnamed protein product [Enterobius vermicularis]|uniref:NR LBD domain-containing protein n=1 Tax=Enterobius vermicularis TaxID=51028 RepID=A0A0N4VHJ3_ENTVE|nr:unnamed protein product [Enterobius vermicularis]